MNASYPHPIIAREGWPFLAAAVGLAVALFPRLWMGLYSNDEEIIRASLEKP